MKRNKGFTLIELLVVIAIIGILSAIVLASLNSARNKAKIASATGSVSAMRSQAEMNYNANTGYPSTLCTASTGELASLITASDAQAGSGKTTCNSTTAAWAAQVDLTGIGGTGATSYFCVDSTGFAGNRTNSKGTGTVCASS